MKTAHKLNKDNCKINWNESGTTIFNLIRGLSPYPSAWFTLKDAEKELQIKVYEASWQEELHDLKIGTLVSDKTSMKIAVAQGYIILHELQPPGKKKMSSKDILNGTTFSKDALAC